jgi:hypothetical protein
MIGIILVMIFSISQLLTCAGMIVERTGGIWNRLIVSGVTPWQIFLAFMVEGFLLMLYQLTNFAVSLVTFIAPSSSFQSKILLFSILFIVALNGIIFGGFYSLLFETVTSSYSVLSNVTIILCFTCGL